MSELLSRLNGDGILGLAGILSGLTVLLTVVIGFYWQKVRRSDAAVALKQDMLNRGMSAEDIRIVLDAGTKK